MLLIQTNIVASWTKPSWIVSNSISTVGVLSNWKKRYTATQKKTTAGIIKQITERIYKPIFPLMRYSIDAITDANGIEVEKLLLKRLFNCF